MYQEFFTDTIISRFIKYMLKSTNLPLLHIVEEHAQLIAGVKYIYKEFVILCIKSGQLAIDPNDVLHPSDDIFPSNRLIPGIEGILAEYKVVDYYDSNDFKLHYNFHSKYMYYDSDTHFQLGEYLRYLKDRTGLNLMPYYNCFNYFMVENITLGKFPDSTYKIASPINKKVIAIPVKFGKTYTIAIDSDTPVELRPIIYNKVIGNVYKDLTTSTYYSDELNHYELLPSSQFTKPFLVTIPTPDTKELYAQENNLYLLIQVAKNNDSSIVALEGNYTTSWTATQVNYEFANDKKSQAYVTNLSLLHFNCKKSFAFSDRLIEFLLLGVINDQDEIAENIVYLNKLIAQNNLNPGYIGQLAAKRVFNGAWNDTIRHTIDQYVLKHKKEYLFRDQDGYLNKDLEKLLLNKEFTL